MTDATDTEMALDYYKSGMLNRKPQFVPKSIEIYKTIRGDSPISPRTIAKPGVYDALSNPWGAISVEATGGRLLGIKPDEFEVIEWQVNLYQEEEL